MKDSIGSSVIIQIFLVFIIIFIIFMSAIINYTKTFRIKNQVINIIDRYEGYTTDAKSEVESYFIKQKAVGNCVEINDATPKYKGDKCNVAKYDVTGGGYYYKVIVYIEVTLPLIKKPITIPITGETKIFNDITEGNTDKVTYVINHKEFVLPEIDMDLSVKPAPVEPPSGGGGGSGGACSKELYERDISCGIEHRAGSCQRRSPAIIKYDCYVKDPGMGGNERVWCKKCCTKLGPCVAKYPENIYKYCMVTEYGTKSQQTVDSGSSCITYYYCEIRGIKYITRISIHAC